MDDIQNDLPTTTERVDLFDNITPQQALQQLLLRNDDGRMANGLGAAIGCPEFAFNPFNFPANQGSPFTEQVSNVTTSFKNLRWYLISNFRQFLSELYVEIGLVQTVIDVPVDDALRGGIEIKSKQLSEEQIEELQISMDRDDDLVTIGQAAKWTRLFGGGGILILTNQDPELPLDMNTLDENSNLTFRSVDLWELLWDLQNTEGYDPTTQDEGVEFYNYYGEKVHRSRVMRINGLNAPSFIRPRLRGWGFSVVETLIRSINQYLKATDLSFEVLDEFKLDVYKIKNLVNTLMSPNGQQKISQRVQMANWQKNYQNALVMDSEDDFDHKQLSFSGLAETMEGIRMQVAADMRMPITKLFGTSASKGFATDQNDLEVYNAMVESQVRNKIKYDILRICEIKCQVLFGMIPDDLSIAFKPLRMLSAEQEENVKTSKFNRLMAAKSAGEITRFEFREGCNKGDLFDITLDNSGDELNPDDPQVEDLVAEGFNNPDAPVDEEGTDRRDGAKSKIYTEGAQYQGRGKLPNGIIVMMPKPFTQLQRIERRLSNSPEFDRASYEADGGDSWIDPQRAPLFENPGNVDEGLWERARQASQAAFGSIKWQFVTWWYKKQGGKFR